jgi:NAD+--asparagine ADP-ribosyltransferase
MKKVNKMINPQKPQLGKTNVIGRLMLWYKKYVKRKNLLKKYRNDYYKKLQMNLICNALNGDKITEYVIHVYNCENRCYNRIKNLGKVKQVSI